MNIYIMNIHNMYNNVLKELENASPIIFYSNIQLLNLVKKSRLKKLFNICNSYDLFIPNDTKPYSILNTDKSDKPGVHWVGVYQLDKNIFVYDSFARSSNLMKPFIKMMKAQGFKVYFVNKKKDQHEQQLNCGLRCLVWLIFTDKYGIDKSINI